VAKANFPVVDISGLFKLSHATYGFYYSAVKLQSLLRVFFCIFWQLETAAELRTWQTSPFSPQFPPQ